MFGGDHPDKAMRLKIHESLTKRDLDHLSIRSPSRLVSEYIVEAFLQIGQRV
jgi:predicted metalloenzyme YecM